MCFICDALDGVVVWPQDPVIIIECKNIDTIAVPERMGTRTYWLLSCKNCPNLTKIESDHHLRIQVNDCPKLSSISGPTSEITIHNCELLSEIPNFVKELYIFGSSRFIEDVSSGTRSLPPVVSYLRIENYPLGFSIFSSASLQHLVVRSCTFLVEIYHQPNLYILEVEVCPFAYVSKRPTAHGFACLPSGSKRGLRDAAQRARETVRRRAMVARVLDGVLIPPLIGIILAKIVC